MEEPDSALQFPCQFPIKAMGLSTSGFEAVALQAVRRHAPDFDPEQMHARPSRQGRYLSVTFTINATSREQLDTIYLALTGCDDILVVL